MIARIVATVESWYRFCTQIYRGMNCPKKMLRPLSVIMVFVHRGDYFRNRSLPARCLGHLTQPRELSALTDSSSVNNRYRGHPNAFAYFSSVPIEGTV